MKEVQSIELVDIAKGLNEISWDILDFLNKSDEVPYNTLRKSLEISQEKCYKEIARLEGSLLIESRRDPKDKRSLLFFITNYGKIILKHK